MDKSLILLTGSILLAYSVMAAQDPLTVLVKVQVLLGQPIYAHVSQTAEEVDLKSINARVRSSP